MTDKRIAAVLTSGYDPRIDDYRSYYVVTEADGTVWTPIWRWPSWEKMHTDLATVQWDWA